jgi:diguanylate cyclase (GGDEF)-like protein
LKFKSGKLFTVLALPVILAAIGIVWVTFQLLEKVSSSANATDHERTSQIVQSAFAVEVSSLQEMVSDNAKWDDAAKIVYGSMDMPWITRTWGVISNDRPYDEILVVDPGESIALAAFKNGKKHQVEWHKYVGPELQTIFEKLSRNADDSNPIGTIVNINGQAAILAAGYILPTTDGFIPDIKNPRALVILRYLDKRRIDHISKQYVLKGLQISVNKPNNALPENELKTLGQNVAAYVTWQDLAPGEQARQSAFGITIMALSFLVFIVAVIGLVCWSLIKTIAKREAEATRSARIDPLTSLPNRLAITEEMAANANKKIDYAVAFADLDGFKDVNDTFDHETGDKLLHAVAVGMQYLVKPGTKIARLGGDEFIVMFTGANRVETATKFARDFITFINGSFDISGRHTHVGVSIGIASSDVDKKTPAEIMRQADIAMYHAKSNGKNCFSFYSTAMDDKREVDMQIAEDLVRYIADDKICLVYQPIVDAGSHQIVKVEALARWPQDAERQVGPAQFVAIAEQKGLIDKLGETILAMACEQLRHWPHLNMNVNISPLQLNNPDFVERTLAIIRNSGVEPNRIEIELTESHLLDDIARTEIQFKQLRVQGVRIALDDFGAGFASLGYLQKLEFDCIKIDKAISDQFDSGSKGLRIVQATALMARGVAAQVVGEGIESAEQGNILHLAGCTHLQGYHFHKPKSAAEITDLLTSQRSEVA